MYDSQADNIDVDDIAENRFNRSVLYRIKRNKSEDYNELWIKSYHEDPSVRYGMGRIFRW